jgi:hypothetical protein
MDTEIQIGPTGRKLLPLIRKVADLPAGAAQEASRLAPVN